MGHAIRRHRVDDAKALAHFQCAAHGEKYTREVQRMIQGDLATMVLEDDLEDREMRVAENPDGQLVGVIVWRQTTDDPTQHFIELLAVVKSHWRRGYGRALKREAMALIAANGGRLVVSRVHRQNMRMLQLNVDLGIGAIRDPEDGGFKHCAAPIKRRAGIFGRHRR
jgi:GNAT superfamily N-acetyltransferase